MIEIIFILFILFQNIILRCFPEGSFISYWDEFCFLLLGFYYIIMVFRNRLKEYEAQIILILSFAIIVGLAGNIWYGYQDSLSAVIRDIVGFLKFPITMLALYRLSIVDKLSKKLYKCIPFLRGILWFMLVCGLSSLFINLGMSQPEYRSGIHPFMFFYTHPTYLTTGVILILCTLNAAEECGFFDDMVGLILLVLAMRTKGFAFAAVYVFMKYGGQKLRRFKALYWIVIGILVIATAYNKLALYATYSNSPRQSLYLGALQLMRTCFPIGSGFATFASHLSGRFLSSVYNFITIAGMYDEKGAITVVIGDSGFPYYLGQFGFLGCALIGYAMWKLFQLTIDRLNEKNRLPIILMWIMLFISLTSETILLNNGFEIAFFIILIKKLSFMKQTGKLHTVRHSLYKACIGRRIKYGNMQQL